MASKLRSIFFWMGMFCLPIALLCLSCFLGSVYPFGAESFLTEDLLYQYIDFFTWFRGVLYGQNNLLYTGALSLGTNAWGIYSYYLASPLNFLVAAFDVERMTLAIYVIVALKLGLIQVSTTRYLYKRFDIPRLSAGVLALGFTLGSWMMGNLRNPLWLDVCYMLPIAMLGTWHFLHDGKLWRVAIPVALNIVFCWYMGYMGVLFLSCYALFEAAVLRIDDPEFGVGIIGRRAGGFALAMVFALGLAAWTFAPTVLAMMGEGVKTEFPFGAHIQMRTLVSGFFSGTFRLSETPQLFVGSLPLLLAAYFVFCGKEPIAKRIAYVLFIAFLIAGVAVTALYYVWCGMREPNGFYCRNAFTVGLTVLWAAGAAVATIHERGLSPASLALAVVGMLAAIAYTYWRKRFESTLNLGVAVAAVLLAALCLVLYSRGKEDLFVGAHSTNDTRTLQAPLAVQALCLALCACELVFAAHFQWKQLYTNHPHKDQEAYIAASRAQLDELRASDDGIYRVDKTFTRAFEVALNEGMSQGYLQLSSYCSAHNIEAVNFLNALGYSNPGDFHVRYTAPLAVSDSLLGVKYVFVDDPALSSSLYEERNAATVASPTRLLSNPNALSLGYLASPEVCDFRYDPLAEEPFELQNRMLGSILGQTASVFEEVQATQTLDMSGVQAWSFTVPAGKLGYFYIRDMDAHDYGVFTSIDGGAAKVENWRFRHAAYALDPGTHTVQIATTAEAAQGQTLDMAPELYEGIECKFYLLDIAAFEQAIARIAQHQMEFSTFQDGLIEGSITSPDDGYVLLSVPNENGWTVQVNGREVQPRDAFGGACMAIPVQSGENTVHLEFFTPGLRAGAIVSCVSAVLLLVVSLVQRRREREIAEMHAGFGADWK